MEEPEMLLEPTELMDVTVDLAAALAETPMATIQMAEQEDRTAQTERP